MLSDDDIDPPIRPRVPLAPVLSRSTFAPNHGSNAPCVLDAGGTHMVTSGRIAIALALREMGVGAGDAVLVPAYHSKSMIAPLAAGGVRPVFYRVGMDTSIDLTDIAAKLDPSVKAIMVTSYFGIPQDFAVIRAFCDLHHIALLEDCAHSFFGEHGGRPVGSWGDYAIASSMKFFPISEGGCLVSARHALTTAQPRSAGIGFEAKAALKALEKSFAYGRLPLLKATLWLPLGLKALALRTVKGEHALALVPSSSDSSYEFDPRWLDKRSSVFSRWVMRRTSHARIVDERRRNYIRLQQALGALPGCRPLFAALPEGACPWLFPLFVEQPEPIFERLRAAGVPIARFAESLWPGVDATVCANSTTLSRCVLGFPVHQELREDELAWIIATITATCAAVAKV